MFLMLALFTIFLWIVSLRFLPLLFRLRALLRRKANNKSAKIVLASAFALYLGGWVCNFTACLANGSWKMPIAQFDSEGNIVYPADLEACEKKYDFLHTCVKADTKLVLFVDRFRFFAFDYIFSLSIGDFLIAFGTIFMVIQRIWIFLPRKKPH